MNETDYLSLSLILSVPLIIIFYTIAIRNNIISLKNKAKRSWADVAVYVNNKLKVLPTLEKLVKEHKEFESSLLTEIVSLRNYKLSKNSATNDVKDIEEKFNSLLKGINLTVENYPELKSAQLYNNLMKEVVEQQENISASVVIFNSNVEMFNTYIQSFPNNIINNTLNKEDILESFEDKTSLNSEFSFYPNL